MGFFDGRPDLLLLFVAQVLFIVLQLLILMRLGQGSNVSPAELFVAPTPKARSRGRSKKRK